MIPVTKVRIFWSTGDNGGVRDVYVSQSGIPEQTDEYYSQRWDCVTGDCNRDWLKSPDMTPEFVFGDFLIGYRGFANKEEAERAIREFAKIDACGWARKMVPGT